MDIGHRGHLKRTPAPYHHWCGAFRAFSYLLPLAILVTGTPALGAIDHEARSGQYLTVCGDPNNLPFSNQQLEGFENKIAELIAAGLDRPLHYRWWPQTVGFVRNTLQTRLCDLIMGINTVNDLVQNTNPYYRSVYTLVYRRDAGLNLHSLKDPAAKGLRIGVVAGTPPVSLLTRYDLLGQTRSYERAVDTRLYAPARDAVEDVARGLLDLAVIWGPIAGDAARKQPVPLTLVPLPAEEDGIPLAFSISLGIRPRETAWKHELNALLERLAPQILTILQSYAVPLLDMNDQLIFDADGYRIDQFIASVPATAPGATTVNTGKVEALREQGHVTLIDVMPAPPKPAGLGPTDLWLPPPRLNIPGSVWLPNIGYGRLSDELTAYLQRHLERLTGGDHGHRLIVYCRADCWMSWNAAKRLAAAGYTAVYWYPDGVTGWEAAGLPLAVSRPVPPD